ncbi:MAG: YfhO family protein [Clostridiales bacterium]|nr:YfhO family protein [Clostridiales bacterium]
MKALLKPRERAGTAFLLALALAAALFLPFLIYDKGLFIYYGDFNVQQIPFYRLAHDSIREGNLFWNWQTDLGANFIGSYSFYLLGSPFFWLTLPFPSEAVPYLMAPLLMLKFACASLTAYGYMRRFVSPEGALLGGLLYAFSGFSLYNVFFNHFHEAIVYFPLMLLGLERLMKDGRKGVFALSLFLSALSNYYFFIGQCFFLLIYWTVRLLSGGWRLTSRRFFALLFEAAAGTAAAAVILLPSFYAVIQNPRTGELISGWDLLIHTRPQRLYDILHSFFFPPDLPARPNFFPDADNKWASMSAWLPVFGCTGVIAYFQSRRHTDWLRRMLTICMLCAAVPVLGAMFQLFNRMYYARWYYMMVLLLALATVLCFEQRPDAAPVGWKRALGWSAGITGGFVLFIGLAPRSWTPDAESGRLSFGLMADPVLFWLYVGIAAAGLLLTGLLVLLHRSDRPRFPRWSVAVTVCLALIAGWLQLGTGKNQSNYLSPFVAARIAEGPGAFELEGIDCCRVDIHSGMDNLAMYWQLPSIQAFHSIVPGSVMEFYQSAGVERNVASRPDASHYALRGLLSVRYLFDYDNADHLQYKEAEDYFSGSEKDPEGALKMPGWSWRGMAGDFRLYENDYWIPYGFTYDRVMSRSQYEALAISLREQALLKALVLEDADMTEVAALLEPFDPSNVVYGQNTYLSDCLARRETAADDFSRDNSGFSAVIDLQKENLVFFSVPFEAGWNAEVNGEPAKIYRAGAGFMAVRCPAGKGNAIRFHYQTPGLIAGLCITGIAVFSLLFYLLATSLLQRRKVPTPLTNPVPFSPDRQKDSTPSVADKTAAAPQEATWFDLYRFYPGGTGEGDSLKMEKGPGQKPEPSEDMDIKGS